MKVLNFFNDVVANPAELPDLPPEPEVVAEIEAEIEAEAEVEAEPKTETQTTAAAEEAVEQANDETFEVEVTAPASTSVTEPVISDAEPADPPDSGDSDVPTGHGRVESAPAMTARERERMKPKPAPVKKKPGEGNGFFDQLLRQQNTEPRDGQNES